MEKPAKNEESGASGSGQSDSRGTGVAVTARDVLLGRGNLVNNSAGNQMFRGLVRENAGEYVRCESRAQKELIARRILSQVGQYGGRFMRQVEGEGILPSWEVVSDDVALSKVRQALRDMAQQPVQSLDNVTGDGAPEDHQPTILQEFATAHIAAAATRSDEDDVVVQNLLQQIYLCRQAAAEQTIRLRALVAELEHAAAAAAGLSTAGVASLPFGGPAAGAVMGGGLAGRDDAAALNDLYYARALQESELREELAQLRLRGADLSAGGLVGGTVGDYNAARLSGDAAQRHRADLFRQRQEEEAAMRQYQQLRLLESQARFAPFPQGSLADRSTDMDRSLLSLGLDHRMTDTTSLDLMLRGAYNDHPSLFAASLMTPASRPDSQQVARGRDDLRLYGDPLMVHQPTSVDHEYKDDDDDKTADSAPVDVGATRGRMKRGDSADSSS